MLTLYTSTKTLFHFYIFGDFTSEVMIIQSSYPLQNRKYEHKYTVPLLEIERNGKMQSIHTVDTQLMDFTK